MTPLPADVSQIPLALYIHIPWCERKCPYCDFNSHENFDPAFEAPYVDALLADLASQRHWGAGRSLCSIFIGGGTPSLFSAHSIAALLDGIDQLYGLGDNVEITLESNPGSAEAERYQGYRMAGVNRLSIGVQSFNKHQLTALGRVHNAAQARLACDLAARHFDRFNIDLMHGLPDQTQQLALADLNEGIDRCGGHLSWYQLTIEPNTVFWSRPPDIPVEDTLADIQDSGEQVLNSAGFEQYEVSAWCRAGQASLHNLNYWQFGDYLGIGAGAHGKITTAKGEVIRTQRTRLPKDYLSSVANQRAASATEIKPEHLSGEFMLNALRLKSGVDTQLFEARTGVSIAQLMPTVNRLVGDSLLAPNPAQRLKATDHGFRFLNNVLAAFLPEEN